MYFKFYLLLYANDTVIFAESAADLQSALKAMYLYCVTWNLKVNTAKNPLCYIFQISAGCQS